MAQTKEGAEKICAEKCGISLEEYRKRVSDGEKYCYCCKTWKVANVCFGRDSTRYDGFCALCVICRNQKSKDRYIPKPRQSKAGSFYVETRDGDKQQARSRVNTLVRCGRLARPQDVPCFDCGHMGDDRRHEYDHYLGYSSEHQLHVQAVCHICHHKRDNLKAKQTHCIRGHEFTPENTFRKPNGNRGCKECRKMHDKNRGRDAEYWREYRQRKKEKNGGNN